MICNNVTVKDGTLYFAEMNTVDLAQKYGTPLYLLDENKIRENCRTYFNAMNSYFKSARVIYAAKANSFKRIYNVINEEGLYSDAVSVGEIYTALKAGFPMEKVYFHSNNKTDFDIKFALENGVGVIVIDNEEELFALEKTAGEMGKKQDILIRVTPGIDPHTFEAVATGKVDSKFGFGIETGLAEDIVKKALALENVNLLGFHCHVGSQVFDSEVFYDSSEIMFKFMADIFKKYSYKAEQLNLGGGYGVRYLESDPEIDIDANIKSVAATMENQAKKYNMPMPMVLMEPGRSIVADAGMTLYEVGMVKKVPGYRNYVSIDGGMTDNPRYALYGSDYTVLLANKCNEKAEMTASLVGRCCESGDIIKEEAKFPNSVKRGDTVAVLTTGAYNYSMASNYNRVARPPIVMIKDKNDYLAVKRESLEDLIKNDL